jgi:hypothetical protein
MESGITRTENQERGWADLESYRALATTGLDAVRCFQAYAAARNRTERLRFAEAEAWILDHKAEGPFAFVTICESLGIEPNCMREGIGHARCDFAVARSLAAICWRLRFSLHPKCCGRNLAANSSSRRS